MKKDQTPEPQIDESQLSEEDRTQLHPKFPWGWVIFFAIVTILIIVCISVIAALGWPTTSTAS